MDTITYTFPGSGWKGRAVFCLTLRVGGDDGPFKVNEEFGLARLHFDHFEARSSR